MDSTSSSYNIIILIDQPACSNSFKYPPPQFGFLRAGLASCQKNLWQIYDPRCDATNVIENMNNTNVRYRSITIILNNIVMYVINVIWHQTHFWGLLHGCALSVFRHQHQPKTNNHESTIRILMRRKYDLYWFVGFDLDIWNLNQFIENWLTNHNKKYNK